MQGYGNLLASSIGTPGAALTASITQTSLLHSTMKWDMISRYFRQFSSGQGVQLKWALNGIITTVVTTPGTLTLVVKAGSIAVFTSQAIPLNIVAKAAVPWWAEIDMELTTEGASAIISGFGKFSSEAYINTAVLATGPAPGVVPMPVAGYTAGTAFDDTAAATWDVFATWSISNANSIQVKQARLFQFN